MTDAVSMYESVEAIKATVRMFPGCTLPCHRQTGKTTAILQLIQEDHQGEAAYFTFSARAADLAEDRWRKLYPDSAFHPRWVWQMDQLIGTLPNLPVYVDEWWQVSAKQRAELDLDPRVRCRIGTWR